MNIYADISKALETAATAILTPFVGVAIAYPNVPFQPAPGTPYAKLNHLWAPSSRAGTGVNSLVKRVGVFQVALVYPSGNGMADATAALDGIVNGFKEGTRYTTPSGDVLVISVYPSPPLQEDDGDVRIPVTVNWQAYTL